MDENFFAARCGRRARSCGSAVRVDGRVGSVVVYLRFMLLRVRSTRTAVRRLASAVSSRGGAIITGPDGNEIHLPPAEKPVGPTATGLDSYKKALICPATNILRTSTHVGTDQSNAIVRGKVGDGPDCVPKDLAKELARSSGLRLLSTIHDALDGDMSRVEQVLKLTGLVNGADDFTAHGAVINGCSEVLIEAFGPDKGVGVRTCSGTGSLIGAVSCDVELLVRPAK